MASTTQKKKPVVLQRDMFIEVDEKLLLRDKPTLQAIADALPETPYIKPYAITQVLPICEDVLYRWIAQFKFNYIDLGAGDRVPRYGIERKSFLAFLATRVNYIR